MLSTTLFIVLVVLNLADIGTTAYVLTHGGHESNPVMKWIIDAIGIIPGLFGVKIPILAVCYFFITQEVILLILCAIYAGVVFWNVQQVIKVRQ